MQKKVFLGLGVLIAVVGIGFAIGKLASRAPAPKAQPPVEVADPVMPTNPPAKAPAPTPTPVRPVRTPTHRPTAPVTNLTVIPVVPEVAPATNQMLVNTNWEAQLDEILSSDTDDTNKVKQMFAMFPDLPEDGQEEMAQHLSNLVEDEDYAPLGQLLTNAKLPEEVLDVLIGDLLNRPNAVKLPLFLDIARNPGHAKAEEARELLELYLDEEYGSDWGKWQQKMQEWLKENPD
jgi:hypothetical protein